MPDVVRDFFEKSVIVHQQHSEAMHVASSTTDEEPLASRVFPLLVVDPVETEPASLSWTRVSVARSAVQRHDIEAAVVTTWLRGARDLIRASAQDKDPGVRWSVLERLEREVAEIGRQLLLDNAQPAVARSFLVTRVLCVHAMLLLDMRRAEYGEHRGRFADPAYAATQFGLYAGALRHDLAKATVQRLADIMPGERGITDPWATEEYTADWRSWYAKVRVFEPDASELEHYLARVLHHSTLALNEQVVDVVRSTAGLLGAPTNTWYAAPGVVRYGDAVQVRGGSLWPLLDGGGVGADGVLGDDASAAWVLVSATDRPHGGEVRTEEPFHLRSTSGEGFLHDTDGGGPVRVGEAPQPGGSFFLRGMEVEPGEIVTTRTTCFLVGVQSRAYLQATVDGTLLLRPWKETHHAGPDFPTWCLVEPGRAGGTLSRSAAVNERDVTMSLFQLLGNLPDPLGQAFSLLGTVVGFLWPAEPVPTWNEIKAYFQRELGKALANAELGALAGFMDGIERSLETYRANVKAAQDAGAIGSAQSQERLFDDLDDVNDTLVQDLSKFLYPVSATPLDTLPFYWRVARYKLCIIAEMTIYDVAAFDEQHQLDSFIGESRPVLKDACAARLMRERMNSISSVPERYNEALGQYMLRFRDNFTGKVVNVDKRNFITTSNCVAHADYPGYNAYARSELAKHRMTVRDSYIGTVRRLVVDPFNKMVGLSTNTPPLSLTSTGNDGWTIN